MKQITGLILALASAFCVQAQKTDFGGEVRSESAVNFASGKVEKVFVAPPEQFLLKSASAASAEFQITYSNFSDEAKQAFEYAVAIWKSLINSPVAIKLSASWEPMEENLLAMGKPSAFHMNFDGAQVADVYYPVALAEKLIGKQLNADESDIVCTFNKKEQWYFGLDGKTPETQYDFVTAALHEIAHGLGFAGFFKDNGSAGFFGNGNNLPSIYDYFIHNATNQQLADNNLFYRPSEALRQQLTSGELKFRNPIKTSGGSDYNQWVYAPVQWQEGASIYHLIGGNGLMDPFAMKGRAIHNPGKLITGILSELGWVSVSFDFQELKDKEEPCAELMVDVGIEADIELTAPELWCIFSLNNCESTDSVRLLPDTATKRYKGNLPLNFHRGAVHYYLKIKEKNTIYTLPSSAPAKSFSFRIGPDYKAPNLAHNPKKMIAPGLKALQLFAMATDNIGINSVHIEYNLDGIMQEPVVLDSVSPDAWAGELVFQDEVLKSSTLEYRIVAQDQSSLGNKKTMPSCGFYPVSIFNPLEPVVSYVSDFEEINDDFVTADFDISRVAGFSGSVLHTRHPYPVSAFENEKYNLMAILKHPVIIQEGGQMCFDEVVLVEPGETRTTSSKDFLWDYVIVEGSSDLGRTWLPLTPEYDSGVDQSWTAAFVGSTVNTISHAVGNQSMFLKNTINLTENTGFFPGDTVIFRFRLASDNSVNGWGWAIDNLEIQKGFSTDSDLISQIGFNVYPNPFSDRFFVDFTNIEEPNSLDVTVTDLFGKTIYRKEGNDVLQRFRASINIPNVSRGIYLVNVSNGTKVVYTQKMIKN